MMAQVAVVRPVAMVSCINIDTRGEPLLWARLLSQLSRTAWVVWAHLDKRSPNHSS